MFERKKQTAKSTIPLEDGLLGAQRELDALWAAVVGAAAGASSTRVLFVVSGSLEDFLEETGTMCEG